MDYAEPRLNLTACICRWDGAHGDENHSTHTHTLTRTHTHTHTHLISGALQGSDPGLARHHTAPPPCVWEGRKYSRQTIIKHQRNIRLPWFLNQISAISTKEGLCSDRCRNWSSTSSFRIFVFKIVYICRRENWRLGTKPGENKQREYRSPLNTQLQLWRQSLGL